MGSICSEIVLNETNGNGNGEKRTDLKTYMSNIRGTRVIDHTAPSF